MATPPFRQLTRPHVIASAVLVTWACSNETPLPDPDAYDHGSGGSSAKPGTGGSSAQPGTGGSLPGTGGSSATGSGATGGTVVTGGAGGAGGTSGAGSPGGRSGAGGTTSGAGRSASGGTTGVGGATGSGGVNGVGGASTGGASTGGSVSAGGVNSGGTGTAGRASSSGGTGMAGIPNDPSWKPPDMTATAKLIVLYQVQQKTTPTYSVGMMLQLKNQTDAAYDLSKVTIRYWMSSEPAPMPRFDYTAAGLSAASAPTFVSNGGVSYIEMSFKTGGTVPIYVDQNSLNNTNMSVAVQAKSNTGQFDQSNDWSFDATASAYKANPKITLYDKGVLIWGCEPSHACPTSDSGEGGAGGQSP